MKTFFGMSWSVSVVVLAFVCGQCFYGYSLVTFAPAIGLVSAVIALVATAVFRWIRRQSTDGEA